MFVVIKTGAKLCMLADIMKRRGTLVGVDVAPVILHGAIINIESVNAGAGFGLETNFLCCLCSWKQRLKACRSIVLKHDILASYEREENTVGVQNEQHTPASFSSSSSGFIPDWRFRLFQSDGRTFTLGPHENLIPPQVFSHSDQQHQSKIQLQQQNYFVPAHQPLDRER
jgi:hypothetical protein